MVRKMKSQRKARPKGVNPNSLSNLNREGSEPRWGEAKKRRSPTVTDEGWNGADAYFRALGYASISDFLEFAGRRLIEIPPIPTGEEENTDAS